ncbi:hypothetical protein L3N51_02040 [Metallosphaera sp. J1]|uniref:PaREP1 family protein n=1 Tax=Metallosphaera TaxID=41980 RepID=UPI001EDDA45F|nr:PaREP1 family protein [Metallosphaera javensis (ex Hofmann et al. 2022)]MCG3109744.1 hypothetical protein [Metallosphaera javensis (ex Hofmann et al. 2022)]BCS91563.1 MAG: hypothetical protein MjAS7_0171 [Metallosphaera javensis (ex Sakai et al. 2022)]
MRLLTASDVYLLEADELLEKGDIVQASEKYYKAAEETIKLLAIKHDLKDIIQKVNERGEWDIKDFFDVVYRLKEAYENITKYWDCAIALQTVTLEENALRKCVESVRKLVELGDKVANN